MKGTLVLAAAFASVIALNAQPAVQTGGQCAQAGTSVPRVQNPSRGPHAYFEALAAKPECIAAFSLRDAAQLDAFKHTKMRPGAVTYDPANDRDPRRQDAAKITVPAGKVSLPNQVRLPLGTMDDTTTLVTWDAWFGSEFQYGKTGIATYKTFQFASPDRLWFEVRTRFKQDEAQSARRAAKMPKARRNLRSGGELPQGGSPAAAGPVAANPEQAAPTARRRKRGGTDDSPTSEPVASGARVDIGVVDARGYGAGGTALGPNVAKGAPLSPQAGTFTIRAETWTRYWVLIDQRANGWDLVSLWVGDEDHDPVQIIDRREFNVKGSVKTFWLEYNTSSHGNRGGVGERIGYVRNVVMLRNVRDVPALFQRPVK